MPNLRAKEPVEGYKLTQEQKAFFQAFRKVSQMQTMLKKGLMYQMTKLKAMQKMAEEIEGKKKELMLQAPEQGFLDVEDEGMVQSQSQEQGPGAMAQMAQVEG